MESFKKVRSTNFSKEEELLLLQEIAKFQHIIECKTTNKINNKDKDEAWQKILNGFNSKNMEVRSMTEIKSKHDNLKTRTRKEVAKERAYLRGTGGGPAVKKELDPIVEAPLNIINIKMVVRFSNMFDASTSVFIPEKIPSPEKLEQQIFDSEILFIETVEDTDEYSLVSMQSPTLLEFNKENVEIINLPSTPNYETALTSTLKGKRKRENPSVKI